MQDPITALRDVPANLSEQRLDAARARTHDRIDELSAPPKCRRRRSPVLALAATAAVAGAIVVTTGDTPVSRPAVATAATVLRDLAQRAGDQRPAQLQPGEYYAVRVVQRQADGPRKALDLRYWADSRGEGRQVAILDGKTRRDVPLGAKLPRGLPLPDLAKFPIDEAGVAARMRELARHTRVPGETGEPTTRDYILAASQMVTDQRATPPAVLRAIFTFLSAQPGMRLIGDVTDPLGRPGKAVAADGDEDHEGVGVELIVNPDTGRPLALVHYEDGDVDRPWLQMTREEGVVRGTAALP